MLCRLVLHGIFVFPSGLDRADGASFREPGAERKAGTPMEHNRRSRTRSPAAIALLSARLLRTVSLSDLALFLGSFLLALLVHLYIFTHKLLNLDDVGYLFGNPDFALSSGRWLLSPVSSLGAYCSSPWVNGLLGACFLALGVVFTEKALGLTHGLSMGLTALVLTAFPTVALTYSYMFSAFQYLLSLALAAAGACLIARPGRIALMGGVLCVTLSMGCYQAYFCYAATLLLLVLILRVCGRPGRGEVAAALRFLSALALAMLLYFLILRLCLALTGTSLTPYQGIDQMGKVTPAVLLTRIGTAYREYFAFFRNEWQVFHRVFVVLSRLSMVLGVLGLAWAAWRARLWQRPCSLVLLVAAAVLFPLSSALIFVMTGGAVHMLMVYPLALTLCLPGLLADRLPLPRSPSLRRAALGLTGSLLAVQLLCGFECCLVTNHAYLALDLSHQAITAYYNRLLTRMEETEGYTSLTPVAMIGQHQMEQVLPVSGLYGSLTGKEALNMYNWPMAFWYYLGAQTVPAHSDQVRALEASPEVQAMPSYPAPGSLDMMDGILVVKLSQNP